MGTSIYLIGTRHKFQVRDPQNLASDADAFKSLVTNAATQYQVRLIAEEMNLESLESRGATQSICQEVAHALGKPHCYCEPNSNERAVLGIEDVDDLVIRLEAWLNCPRGTSQEDADKKAQPRIRAKHEKREKEWLRRLKAHGLFPVLFICGDDHVNYFRELAEHTGFPVTVLQLDWQPT
jgi:hypothetical protein